jgi:alpha-D-xyloside xylohydrolase
VSQDFRSFENEYFIATRAVGFDPETGTGTLAWERRVRSLHHAFDQTTAPFEPATVWEFPHGEYPHDFVLPFSLSFVSPRTVRLRIEAHPFPRPDGVLARAGMRGVKGESLMLVREPEHDNSWSAQPAESGVTWRNTCGSVALIRDPWRIEFRDISGRLLTATHVMADSRALQNSDPLPFLFVRRAEDYRRRIAAVFSLAPDEKIFGGGESFTRLNKRGQRLVLWATDALSVQTGRMYKPVPFFMSSRGYGMFVHTSAPLTFDFGCSYDGANIIYLGDERLDLFIFFGSPKEILSEYTALTGRSPLPPLWSFGLWMSRLTYRSEEEVRGVARRLRAERIPCDVIHLDTGWFEHEWRCDYRFSPSRFPDARGMLGDLRRDGFRVSVWQLPYMNPNSPLFREMTERGYAVRDPDGAPPAQDAVLDFSNPAAVRWYQGLLAELLETGVSAVKADFGEAAPLRGTYASGRSGMFEHNLYPLRYNLAVAGVTREMTGDSLIWARSAWAGSQRCPVHWGGDAEPTDSAMAATLRAGLSLGLCGFTFFSHDIGGFVGRSPEALYRRWLPFGMLTSHSRCHGEQPKEPWHYSERFVEEFRRAVELKYRLMPYIYAQAAQAAACGHPLVRTLFFEFPDDPGSWLVEDEYLFGSDLLVAPLMEDVPARDVYLPPGEWIDYQSGAVHYGPGWRSIAAGKIPIILLVRGGAALPHIGPALSTAHMDWSRIELRVFARETDTSSCLFALPGDSRLHTLHLERTADGFRLDGDPLEGKVMWEVTSS